MSHPWSANRQAAKAIALRTDFTIAERRELLAALGLLTADGHTIAPDPRRVEDPTREDDFVEHGGNGSHKQPTWERPALLRDRSSLPPGLRDRLPDATPVTVARDRCGSPAGHSAHAKRGEKPCEPCRVAYNAHQAQRRARRRAERAAAGEAA